MFEPTAKSAIEYARENRLDEWVHEFLCGEGKNRKLSDAIKSQKIVLLTPREMSLNLLKRCVGSEPDMEYRLTNEEMGWFWNQVKAQAKRFKDENWDMPPLIASEEKFNGMYLLRDGNHRLEALKKLGVNKYWVILGRSSRS